MSTPPSGPPVNPFPRPNPPQPCVEAPKPEPNPQPDDLLTKTPDELRGIISRLIKIIHEMTAFRSQQLDEFLAWGDKIQAERATRIQDQRELSSALESEKERGDA